MNFYRLRHSIDEKVVGIYDQVNDAIIPTTWDDPNYLESFFLRKAPENVYLPKGKLAKRAKETDLISASFPGFTLNLFVSALLKDIINVSLHYGIQFFETALLLPSGKELEYWILHPFEFGYKYLNIEESLFVVEDRHNEVIETVIFDNAEQIKERYKEIYNRAMKDPNDTEYLMIRRIAFREDADGDFFCIRTISTGGIGFFVSERLKGALEKAGCTGIVYTEVNERFP